MGLTLLLLFSPCKVRNFIQSELGVEQTQVSSKSQSLAPQFSCQTQEITQVKATTTKLDTEQSSYAGSIHFNVDFDSTLLHDYVQNEDTILHLASSVPFYILYNNFKVDL